MKPMIATLAAASLLAGSLTLATAASAQQHVYGPNQGSYQGQSYAPPAYGGGIVSGYSGAGSYGQGYGQTYGSGAPQAYGGQYPYGAQGQPGYGQQAYTRGYNDPAAQGGYAQGYGAPVSAQGYGGGYNDPAAQGGPGQGAQGYGGGYNDPAAQGGYGQGYNQSYGPVAAQGNGGQQAYAYGGYGGQYGYRRYHQEHDRSYEGLHAAPRFDEYSGFVAPPIWGPEVYGASVSEQRAYYEDCGCR